MYNGKKHLMQQFCEARLLYNYVQTLFYFKFSLHRFTCSAWELQELYK